MALGPKTLEVLRKHRPRQSEAKLILDPAYEDQGLIFASAKGTPLEASNVVNRSFKPLLKRAGITRIKFHELRHTCASVMAKAGVMPRYAPDRLGHADVSLTMDTYPHVLPDTRAEVAKKIEEAII